MGGAASVLGIKCVNSSEPCACFSWGGWAGLELSLTCRWWNARWRGWAVWIVSVTYMLKLPVCLNCSPACPDGLVTYCSPSLQGRTVNMKTNLCEISVLNRLINFRARYGCFLNRQCLCRGRSTILCIFLSRINLYEFQWASDSSCHLLTSRM